MASPVTIGLTPGVVAVRNTRRATLYLQNTGITTLYFKRQLSNVVDDPSPVNYDFTIEPMTTGGANAVPREYKSIDGLRVVSSAVGGILAVYETNNVSIV